MCLAPRYISGTMARPCRPCRNTASLPDTPCASSVIDSASTISTIDTARARRLSTLILVMARVAGFVKVATGGQHAVRLLLFGGGEDRLAGGNEPLRVREPLPGVDQPVADEQHVARLDDRRGAVANRRPLLIVFRRELFDLGAG